MGSYKCDYKQGNYTYKPYQNGDTQPHFELPGIVPGRQGSGRELVFVEGLRVLGGLRFQRFKGFQGWRASLRSVGFCTPSILLMASLTGTLLREPYAKTSPNQYQDRNILETFKERQGSTHTKVSHRESDETQSAFRSQRCILGFLYVLCDLAFDSCLCQQLLLHIRLLQRVLGLFYRNQNRTRIL